MTDKTNFVFCQNFMNKVCWRRLSSFREFGSLLITKMTNMKKLKKGNNEKGMLEEVEIFQRVWFLADGEISPSHQVREVVVKDEVGFFED